MGWIRPLSRNRKAAILLRSGLRRNRRPPRPETPSSNCSTAYRFPQLRLALSLLVGAGSLWVVALATGVLDLHRDDKQLEIGVWLSGSGKTAIEEAIAKQSLFASARLETYVHWSPPQLFGAFFQRTRAKDTWVNWANAVLYIELWQDSQCTIPARIIESGVPTLTFELFTSREVHAEQPSDLEPQPARSPEFGKSTIQRVSETLGIGSTIFDKAGISDTTFEYTVKSKHAQTGNGYAIELVFDVPFEGGTGLAQLEWSQLMAAKRGPIAEFGMKSTSTVYFDHVFDDVRVSPGPLTDEARSYRTKAEAVSLPPAVDHPSQKPGVRADGYAFVNLSATSSARKSLVDFIVFTMAALFGVASASIFDIASNGGREK